MIRGLRHIRDNTAGGSDVIWSLVCERSVAAKSVEPGLHSIEWVLVLRSPVPDFSIWLAAGSYWCFCPSTMYFTPFSAGLPVVP